MIQKYFYSLILIFFLMLSIPTEAQNSAGSDNVTDTNIEGLSIYPNPTTADKIYITSTKNLSKKVEIYNVLGKRIHTAILTGTELNISFLTSGVYLLKIEEAGNTATRKLMVK